MRIATYCRRNVDLYEIYRDDVLWQTVTSKVAVIDAIFDDYVATAGIHDYWFREVSYGGYAV